MNLFFFSVFLCCLQVYSATESATSDTSVQKFFKKLDEEGYDKRTAPNGSSGANSPVDVYVTMFILDISKVDEHDMYFDVQFIFRQTWVDKRLQYSDHIILHDVDKIWTPDLIFSNEKQGSLHKIIHPNIICRITNGLVFVSIRLSERLACFMDFRKYPLDTQKCEIQIESYHFKPRHVELRWSDRARTGGYSPVGAASNLTEMDFDLIDIVPYTNYTVTLFGRNSDLHLILTLKRKVGFFVSRLFAPFIVLVSLSWLSLWMTAKGRYLHLALLLVIMYLMVTASTELNHKMPEVPYTKASDVWIGFCEVLVFAVFLEFIAVSILIERESSKDSISGLCEIELNLDSEPKEKSMNTESLKSPLQKVVNMFHGRSGGNGRSCKLSYSVDRISRIIFPVIFILFNIVYWCVYT